MITLSTDFGDPYPAAMKGVIARRTDARTVDVSHAFPRQDVRAAAFWLRFVLPEFPSAVHCVVVDPGVGTDRKALVVRAGDHALVGPDNGVLLPPARALADPADDIEVFEVAVSDPSSHTFHGRDVFAPVAADVHEVGVPACDRLPALSSTDEFETVTFPEPVPRENGVDGEVQIVDEFGNAITNVPGDAIDGRSAVAVNGQQAPVAPSYAHVDAGDRLVTVGSHGNVEFAVNQGRGDDAFGLEPGDAVELRWP
ncbi:SAM hydrolase/SAM-dependent halogenase family protein [Halorarius litoreus]|uniref:SAM hydrolase/SAM-dependent halogenase family protein n=1 Tax=Halorarius litoreus TaxID=2962676 RepID=UPI0020CCD4DF|nr:SAM-dependent chlorinase/fluorinase [Halorarius litoreus]